LLLFAPAAPAQENIRLACTPRTFQVVPGEPVRVEVTVEADSAAPIRMHIPADALLVLRAVEKLPLERTTTGVIVHKRVVIWQAIEPGTVKMNALSVETQGRRLPLPEITITVRDPGT
jgi:ribosomal protein L11